MKQLDVFGNEVDLSTLPPPRNKQGRKKFATMQEMHGIKAGKTCKTCKHCRGQFWNEKTYYKCELWRQSNCSATDIRLKNVACGKYEKSKGI